MLVGGFSWVFGAYIIGALAAIGGGCLLILMRIIGVPTEISVRWVFRISALSGLGHLWVLLLMLYQHMQKIINFKWDIFLLWTIVGVIGLVLLILDLCFAARNKRLREEYYWISFWLAFATPWILLLAADLID